MRYDTVIFDLDGTLTNSHDGITNAVRYALSKMNLPIPDEAGLRKYIGPPLVDSFQRYAGMDAAAAERGALLFREYYVPTGRFENQVYPGIRELLKALHDGGARVLIATGKPADYKYAVRQMRFFPVVEHLITSQGMRLAIPNRHVFEKAAAWADVVHFMMPSPLGIMGLKHVEKLGIPHTAAFHCQPENITFTLHMGNSRRVNDFVYNRFRDTFFNRFTHIHCPSNMIANQLRQHGYTARLHVISNGISPEYIYGKREKEPWMQGLFNVLMVGRYAGEKRQDELIDACAKSRHAREIQVILAGKGHEQYQEIKGDYLPFNERKIAQEILADLD